jgi:hypothetical protein
MNKFCVEWYSPVTKVSGIVETTKNGVSREFAEGVAEEGNRRFKPLIYTVKEAK